MSSQSNIYERGLVDAGGFSNPSADNETIDSMMFESFEAGESGTTSRLKIYVGGLWVAKPLKMYVGGTWVTKPLKFNSGGTWV